MKKTKRTILIAALALVLAISCMGIGAFAATNSVQVQALMSLDMPIKFNGEVQHFTDVNGKAVYPLLYEGTTYLPVRAVCTLAGIPVDWDQETKSVLLGEGDRKDVTENIFEPDLLTRAEWTTDPAKLVVDDQVYPAGLYVNEDYLSSDHFGEIVLDNQYSIFHCYVVSEFPGTFYVTSRGWYLGTSGLKDNEFLKKVEVQPGVPVEVNVSVDNCKTVHIGWASSRSGPGSLRIVDMYLK